MGGQWGLLHGCAREGGKVKVFMGGGGQSPWGVKRCVNGSLADLAALLAVRSVL